MTTPRLSAFARALCTERAFDVLAVARRLERQGKDVVELQIGDSPFCTSRGARAAGIAAIENNATHYCPSLGLMEFREAVAAHYGREFGIAITAANVVIGAGAKPFEQYFCEAFLEPDDAVLVFTPHFPTYGPNIERRGARLIPSPLRQANAFRPDLNDVERFVRHERRAKAIFINSPHNPTGGVATAEDIRCLADLVRDRDIAVFSDEPYCDMVWSGRHVPALFEAGMLQRTVAAYTLSKSYSMSGWRIGYAVADPAVVDVIGKMVNTSVSCVSPIAQWAGRAALEQDRVERDEVMRRFRNKVELLVTALRDVPDVRVLMPAGTFYVFPDMSAICRRLGITSHGLAMYLLEGADDAFGVACLGGECFGAAGQGFLRFSCAAPDDRLRQAIAFLADAVTRTGRVEQYLNDQPQYRL